jgi:hypothetical protein
VLSVNRMAMLFGFFLLVFFLAAWHRGLTMGPTFEQPPQVVVPAAVQVMMYGGDRFLAASVESVRAAASGRSLEAKQGGYRLRAHRVVAQLNPCHEDNYWIGNAALSFGGASDSGTELLQRAIRCRFWDEVPPFLYGFNQKFFYSDPVKARWGMETAADRSTTNAAGFRQIGIMMTVNSLNDAKAAMAMLEFERDRTRDSKLRQMLDGRIERLQGLLVLREAQRTYEDRFRKPLEYAEQLVQSGTLKALPKDPMGLGYDYKNRVFNLGKVTVDGLN